MYDLSCIDRYNFVWKSDRPWVKSEQSDRPGRKQRKLCERMRGRMAGQVTSRGGEISMKNSRDGQVKAGMPSRRQVLRCSLALGLTASLMSTTVHAQSVDVSKWSPEYIRSIAGTEEVNTAAECSKVVPLDYKGRLTYWYTGPSDAEPEITKQLDKEFWVAWKATYPNIETDAQNIKLQRSSRQVSHALLGNAGPMVVRLQILGGVEFAAKGTCRS